MVQVFQQQDPNIALRRQLASSAVQRGSSLGPVGSRTEALARAITGIAGGLQLRGLEKKSASKREKDLAALGAALGFTTPTGAGAGSDDVGALVPTPSGPGGAVGGFNELAGLLTGQGLQIPGAPGAAPAAAVSAPGGPAPFQDPRQGQAKALFDAGFVNEAFTLRQSVGENEAVAARQAAGRRPTDEQRQIKALVGRGFSEADASDIANGLVVVGQNEQGQNVLINRATGEQRPITIAAGAAGGPPQAAPQAATAAAADVAQAPAPVPTTAPSAGPDVIAQATGPLDTLAAVAEGIPGLSFFVDGEENREAKKVIQFLERDVRKALSLTPRFNEGEAKTLLGLLPKTGFLSTESAVIADFKGFLVGLDRAKSFANEEANNQSLDVDHRNNSRRTAAALGNLESTVNGLLSRSVDNMPKVTTREEALALEPGTLFVTPDGTIRRR